MESIPEMMAVATGHHQSGRLEQADEGYREILRRDPGCAEAWHYFGLLASQQGRQQEAAERIGRAVQLRPSEAAFHRNLGVVHEAMKDFVGAERSYREVVRLRPEDAGAHYCLANGFKAGGALEKAAASYRNAIRLEPMMAEAHQNLGSVLVRMGRDDEAISCYRKAVEVNPNYAEANANLASVHLRRNELDEARAAIMEAIRSNPELADAHRIRGEILDAQGEDVEALASFQKATQLDPSSVGAYRALGRYFRHRGMWSRAEESYQRALQLSPHTAAVLNDLGIVYQSSGRPDDAIDFYRSACESDPEFAGSYNNWGVVLLQQNRPEDAAERFQKALGCEDGNVVETHVNRGNALREMGRLEEAGRSYEEAVGCDPQSLAALSQLVHVRKQLCRWKGLAEMTGEIFSLFESGGGQLPPFSFLNLDSSPAQQLRCAERHAARIAKLCGENRFPSDLSTGEKRAKIRLGYISADFREHAITYLVGELIGRHDRERFEVFGYSYGPDDQSPARQRIASAFDRFVDIRDHSPEAAARCIHEDGIDIAIDLTGYLPKAREGILARRPAPIQVNFLGFAATTGAPWFDYLVADPFVIPTAQESHYRENVVRLPGCYLVSDSQRDVAATPDRSALGLPDTGVILCSFNQTHKVTPEIFRIWMGMLGCREDSVLWLWESNPHAPAFLRKETAAAGIDPDRLIFAPNLPQSEHLARYRAADLALDTFPYNGHTTSCDALWMGCPVLTCAGETFSSRVAGSVLHAGGIPELVTDSLEEYQRLGCELVLDNGRLADLRRRLEEGRDSAGLFDVPRFARNLEETFVQMWDRHLSGKPPEAFSLTEAS